MTVSVAAIEWLNEIHDALQERDRVASAGAEAHTLKLKQRELLAKQADLEGKLGVHKERVLRVLGATGMLGVVVLCGYKTARQHCLPARPECSVHDATPLCSAYLPRNPTHRCVGDRERLKRMLWVIQDCLLENVGMTLVGGSTLCCCTLQY